MKELDQALRILQRILRMSLPKTIPARACIADLDMIFNDFAEKVLHEPASTEILALVKGDNTQPAAASIWWQYSYGDSISLH